MAETIDIISAGLQHSEGRPSPEYLRKCLVPVLFKSSLLLLVPVASNLSMAILVFRSSWTWGPRTLSVPLQAPELVPACTGKAIGCQYLYCELCMLNCYATRDIQYFRGAVAVSSPSFPSSGWENSTISQAVSGVCRGLHVSR
jgi:hypothetical protein